MADAEPKPNTTVVVTGPAGVVEAGTKALTAWSRLKPEQVISVILLIVIGMLIWKDIVASNTLADERRVKAETDVIMQRMADESREKDRRLITSERESDRAAVLAREKMMLDHFGGAVDRNTKATVLLVAAVEKLAGKKLLPEDDGGEEPVVFGPPKPAVAPYPKLKGGP